MLNKLVYALLAVGAIVGFIIGCILFVIPTVGYYCQSRSEKRIADVMYVTVTSNMSKFECEYSVYRGGGGLMCEIGGEYFHLSPGYMYYKSESMYFHPKYIYPSMVLLWKLDNEYEINTAKQLERELTK